MGRRIQKIEVAPGDIREVEVDDSWDTETIRSKLRDHFNVQAQAAEPAVETRQDAPDLPPFVDPPETGPTPEQQLRRNDRLVARAGIQAVTDTAGLLADGVNSLLNKVPGVNLQPSHVAVDEYLEKAGLPEPATPAERIANLAMRSIGGVAAEVKAAEKMATGKVKQLLTEQPAVQVAAAGAAGTGAGVAAEADLGLGGQIVTALAAGLAGGAVASKVSTWADARIAGKTPVTVAEADAVLKANGSDLDPEAVAEGLNQARDARLVEQTTLDALVPDLKNNSVEVARAKARAAKSEFTDVIRGAFKSEDELNSFVNRTIKDRTETAQQVSQLPIDVRRARERLDVNGQNDARLLEDLRVRQEAIAAKLEADRTVPETAPLRKVTSAQNAKNNDDILRRDQSVVRNSRDQIPESQTFGQKTIKRMENIAPRVAIAVRRTTAVANRNVGKRITKLKQFTDDALIKKPLERNPVFKAAVLNGDEAAMEAAVPGSASLYQSHVKPQLEEIAGVREANGLKVRREKFFPRAVANLDKLRNTLDRASRNDLDKILSARAKKKGSPLSETEISGVIGQFVSGHRVTPGRGRTIVEVNPEAAVHYQSPKSSLFDYVHKFEEDQATQQFFKNTLNQDVTLGKSMDAAGIGEVLGDSVRNGELNTQDVVDLAELLDVHFGVSKGGPTQRQRTIKDIFTGLVLGNPLSTVTQFADFGITSARFGPINTLKGLFGKNVADIYESGLRNAASEMRTQRGIARVTKRALESVGFAGLDKLANKAAMNAAYRKRAQVAAHSPDAFRKQLEPLFGKADTEKLLNDLNAGRYTDDVATLMAHDVADIRPISREDMPLNYNQDPHGRLKYSLLSWGLNQMNFVRNNAVKDITAGLRTGDVKRTAKGATRLAGMTVAFGLANTGTQGIKQLITGEDIEVDSPVNIAINALPFGMSGRFAAEALQGRDPGAAFGNLVPFYGLTLRAAGGALKAGANLEVDPLLNATPTGKAFYRLLTGPILPTIGGAAMMGLNALVPAAEAKTHQALYSEPKVQQVEEEIVSEPAAPRGPKVPSDWTYLPPETVINESVSKSDTDRTNARHLREAKDILEVREGNVSETYLDSEGFETAGVGHLLTPAEKKKYPVGTEVPQAVRNRWFEQDSAKAFRAARAQAVDIGRLDLIPILTSVNFQLGSDWYKEHKNTWRLMKEGKFEEAATEAANSLWNQQTPVRVKDLQVALMGG